VAEAKEAVKGVKAHNEETSAAVARVAEILAGQDAEFRAQRDALVARLASACVDTAAPLRSFCFVFAV
jgi:hypothetical protein